MRLNRFRIAGILVVVCFGVAGVVLLFRYQSKVQAGKIFGNMTYLTNCPYIAEKVTLINGSREVNEGLLFYSMHYDGRYAYGDFNRDGLKDAAVVIGEGEGNAYRSALAFLINDGGRLVHKVSHSLGRRGAIINSIKERDGKVVSDMWIHRENDCTGGPTKRVKKVYDYLNPDPRVVPRGYTVTAVSGRDAPVVARRAWQW